MPPQKKKTHPKEKPGLHPRNRHRARYDFKQLVASCPALGPFVKLNAYQDASVDFFDPKAVKMLNKALLAHFYGINNWDIPPNYLCPPIPGRADYIHHAADLLAAANQGQIPTGSKITCLDVGVGASCVYPIIGNKEYGWSFIGADIDPVSIASANTIVESNPALKGKVELRLQKNPRDIFQGIIKKEERIDLTVCNPPFHASLAEAQAGTVRKLSNLKQQKIAKPTLNFGGQKAELWCEGGERRFVTDMAYQSRQFAASCFWFTTLVSKQINLKSLYQALKQVEALEVKTVPMSQGNKTSRLVAWTFLSQEQQQIWIKARW
ncbi:23S rRNA (adenine(1618)-N(6))-methyltransferase RlmF [Pontibacter diazotrophicus]|uniref:Ribosomal RNA large subunit methyltransferase F n=1 Tax=Pontibacter diazotrophicus TaxID=1400979 RepID=A0A3D8LAF3_9BACT|nr:23S rRNA (adenine(1618)-N(6))-methyltransferase RlmF [Pontibacter diazotrophicus]RDV14411.1 23S rRNA (adenine(1618)-N(6))-methyltransferase RlmF [Pontibacter diazotrophicus]